MHYKISKRFEFAASHQLDGLPPEHPCSRLHGHNYAVELELSSLGLDKIGFVYDYRALDRFKRWLDDTFDHRHLNDVLGTNPTAECLAIRLSREAGTILKMPFTATLGAMPVLTAVRVSETQKTWAEVRA